MKLKFSHITTSFLIHAYFALGILIAYIEHKKKNGNKDYKHPEIQEHQPFAQ